MAKKKDSSGGLMSSAGLMRYFDTEETSITISPKTIMIFSVLIPRRFYVKFQEGINPSTNS